MFLILKDVNNASCADNNTLYILMTHIYYIYIYAHIESSHTIKRPYYQYKIHSKKLFQLLSDNEVKVNSKKSHLIMSTSDLLIFST